MHDFSRRTPIQGATTGSLPLVILYAFFVSEMTER
jgi:hypothetical protein